MPAGPSETEVSQKLLPGCTAGFREASVPLTSLVGLGTVIGRIAF